MNATANASPGSARIRVLLAAFVSFLLIAAGAVIAPPAHAAGGTVTATVTSAGTSGVSVQVQASGLPDVASVYAALIVKGTESGLTGGGGYAAFALPFPAVAAGASSFTLTAPADSLDRTQAYEVLIWKQHSNPDSSTIYGRGDVAISSGQWDAVFGAETTDPGTDPGETDPGTDPGETDPGTDPGETDPGTDPGETDPGTDPGETDPGTDPGETDPGTDPGEQTPASPSISVFLADGVTAVGETALKAGDKVVVKGSGYDPAANVGGRGVPIPSTLPQGTYVVFGNFASAWQPSTGAASSTRSVGSQVWALSEGVLNQVPSQYQGAIRSQWVDIASDGTFTATLTLKDTATTPGAYGVYTYGAGGVVNADQERTVALNYALTPKITVSPALSTLTPGITATVSGTNFGAAPGVYAAIIETGTEAGVTTGGGYAAMQYVRPISGGAFSVDLTAAAGKLDRTKTYEVLVWTQHTLPTAQTILARAAVAISDGDWDVIFPKPVAPSISVFLADGVTAVGETALKAGDKVVVKGSGYDPAANVGGRGVPIPSTLPQGTYVVFGNFASAWQPSTGAASSTRSVGSQVWALSEGVLNQVPSQYQGAIRSQWVDIASDGTFTATLTLKDTANTPGAYGVYTYGAGGVVNADQERTVALNYGLTPAVSTTVKSATAKDGLTVTASASNLGAIPGAYAALIETGTEANVTGGSGYLAVQFVRDISGGAFSVDLTTAADQLDRSKSYEVIVWKQHSNPDSSTIYARGAVAISDEQWTALQPEPVASVRTAVKSATAKDGLTVTASASNLGAIPGAYAALIETGTEANVTGGSGYLAVQFVRDISGGAFSVDLTTAADQLDRSKSYEVIVWKQHSNPDSSTIYARSIVQISDVNWTALLGDDDSAAVATTVKKATANDGLTVTAAGSKLGAITGAYVALIETGTEADVTSGGGFLAMQYVTNIDGGAFSVDLTAAAKTLDRTKTYEVIVWQQHSFPNADTIYARSAVTITTAQWNALSGTKDPETPTTPTKPVTPPASVPGGSLRWAISSSFTNYITGPIAKGAIDVSNGATRSGGQFQFGQTVGGDYDTKTGVGSVVYRGSVRFTGHNGILDVTVSNPQIRISSSGAATLSVSSGGAQVDFATLDLSRSVRTTANGAVTYVAAPATLTSAGRDRVLSGYSTTLNPVTFTIGSVAAAPSGTTGTVAAAVVKAKATLPTTPPATDGIVITDEDLEALESGQPTTITASGFQANEEGIKVVVYSTPVLLDTVTADASGTATWKGTLPASLADGVHTLTLQGSVDRGLEFTLNRGATVLGACTVEGATLKWGYKESFRTYIEGIAKGGWTLTDVAYQYPDYVWENGTGSFDDKTLTGLVTYGGSITFTGHDGALNTTLADARIELAGDTGYLVFDVTGTTQDGAVVDQKGVRLAEFALGDAAVVDGVLSLDAIPTTLTAAGAEAFGTYAAGEALDPVTAVIPVNTECGVAVAEEPETEAEASTSVTAVTSPADTDGAPVWPWIVGGLVVVALAGVGGVLIARRNKKDETAEVTTEV
ncbi:MAG: HtaA domain-containing protein [Candidatus Microbacterium colombiense]|nr:MAG: HtaA domain-containing protein [Microbacterium sp.]